MRDYIQDKDACMKSIRQIAGCNENVTNDRIIDFLMTIKYIINLLDIIA